MEGKINFRAFAVPKGSFSLNKSFNSHDFEPGE